MLICYDDHEGPERCLPAIPVQCPLRKRPGVRQAKGLPSATLQGTPVAVETGAGQGCSLAEPTTRPAGGRVMGQRDVSNHTNGGRDDKIGLFGDIYVTN